MLLRILVDNPGATFTKNIDSKFVDALKGLYRNSRDPSVRQLLVENLEYFVRKDDAGLQPVKEWYAKEKETSMKVYSQVSPGSRGAMGIYSGVSAPAPHQGHHHHRRPKNTLPTPEELAARISEAQTSAKLLMQILQSTPTNEILANQLITEFADRCSAASRSIQAFIEADNPSPDESTMLTLFETNEQLATSLSRHQLAVFSAKQQLKQEGSRTNSSNQVPQLGSPSPQPEGPVMTAPTGVSPIPEPVTSGPVPSYGFSGFRASPSPPLAEARPYQPPPPVQHQHTAENPFSDPEPWKQEQPYGGRYTPSPVDQSPPVLGQERHPMADVSPVAPPSQVPHGYQPYRY
ncbi:hypothetical protein ABW20_dc0109674 [Dactylellina cionopaga]|nr:hypothetical protein ABW20_dc0109674 [Dactylellina cionopaga]